VAGQDEGASAEIEALSNPRRDSTVLTIFEVDVSTVADSLLGKPTYRVVNRLAWQGTRHTSLYGTILSLVGVWQPVKVIIDATGVGAGLADFLSKPLGSRLVAFKFSQKSKSDLGWVFISIIETGRYKEFHPMDGEMSRQLEHCQYTIVDGPGKMMRWGVPDGTREVTSGDLVHDDYVLSAALISLLDHDSWGNAVSQIVSPKDILEGMKF
jgi:hypothetical protein